MKNFFLKSVAVTALVFSCSYSFAQTPDLLFYKFDEIAPGEIQNEAVPGVGSSSVTVSGHTIVGGQPYGNALSGVGGSSVSNNIDTGWQLSLTGDWTLNFWADFTNANLVGTTDFVFGAKGINNFRAFTGGVAGVNGLILRATGMNDVLVSNISDTPKSLTFVYDSLNSEIKTYINGIFSASTAQPALNLSSTFNFQIGGIGTGNALSSGALIDEFRLYERALSGYEILSFVNMPSNGTFNGAYVVQAINGDGNFSFDDGSTEETAVDVSFTGVVPGNSFLVVQSFSNPPVNTLGISETVRPYRWVMQNAGINFVSATVKFNLNVISISNPGNAIIYKRPVAGNGVFTAVPTILNGNELWGTVTSFSEFVIASPDVPLPVEMSEFSAESLNGIVVLKWRTESELQNEGFGIFRKTEDENEFTEIASFKTNKDLIGLGTSPSGNNYLFEDQKAEIGQTYFYKLADYDTEGKREFYSEILQVTNELSESKSNSSFRLHQNFPNPFNPETTIKFSVRKDTAQNVRLAIFNVKGELVKELVNEKLPKGDYHFIWNGTDRNGKEVGSGIYFSKLFTESLILSKKMTLLK